MKEMDKIIARIKKRTKEIKQIDKKLRTAPTNIFQRMEQARRGKCS